MGSLLLISGTAIDHLHSTEMDESDLCGALTPYSLSINALTVDGAIYAECFFSPFLISDTFFFRRLFRLLNSALILLSIFF